MAREAEPPKPRAGSGPAASATGGNLKLPLVPENSEGVSIAPNKAFFPGNQRPSGARYLALESLKTLDRERKKGLPRGIYIDNEELYFGSVYPTSKLTFQGQFRPHQNPNRECKFYPGKEEVSKRKLMEVGHRKEQPNLNYL